MLSWILSATCCWYWHHPFLSLPLSLSLQLLRRHPWCDAAAPATPTWPDAPGPSPPTLRRCATSPLIGKNLETWRSSLLSAVSWDTRFGRVASRLSVLFCFFPPSPQWGTQTAGHQHLSSHPICGFFLLRLGPSILSAGSASVFSLDSRLSSSCNITSRLSKLWLKVVRVLRKLLLCIHMMTVAAGNHLWPPMSCVLLLAFSGSET